jgi:endonuclease/exonuclease/phosphatase family metal-dependent hydrolase
MNQHTFCVITSNCSAAFLNPPGVPSWDERKTVYAQALRQAEPTLIGLQEMTPVQLAFLEEQLPEYTSLGVSTADPDPTLLPIWQAKYGRFGFDAPPDPYEIILFYHTESYEPLATGHWWLSPTPERPSIGFGNTAPRVVLWAHLRHRPTGRDFFVLNTHLDHRCIQPMVELCRTKLAAFTGRGVPLIFMGDLNFNPAATDYHLFLEDGWCDSHLAAGGPEAATFLYDRPDVPGGRIDHIFYQGDGLRATAWTRLFSPDPQRRLSDHDPVCVHFSLNA